MPDPDDTTLMFAEAASAHTVVSRQVADNSGILQAIGDSFARLRPPMVITCARGSSDHAATFLKYVMETRLGLLTSSLAPSVSSVYSRHPYVKDSICVAISQSGCSLDLLSVIEGMNDAGVRTIALVNDTTSPLAEISQFVIPLLAGPERSVAATKSFIASLFAGLQLANQLDPDLIRPMALRSVPSLLEKAWALDWSPLVDCLVDARGLYVIGRGVGLSVAGEAALKFKETCNLHAEAYSSAEVRHGPMALFDKTFPVLIFRQNDESASGIDDLAALAAEQGCPVFVVGGETMDGITGLDTVRASPLLEPILQIQTFYKAVNALALRRGYDPDRPPLLKKVTVTV